MGATPGNGQISLGAAGNTTGVSGFSAYQPGAPSASAAPQVVALYATSGGSLQTLQAGTYFPASLTLGSPTANATLVLENPIDMNAAANWQFPSVRGVGLLPEGEYAGQIINSTSAAVNVSFNGSGGLIFANANNSFNAASLQINGGAVSWPPTIRPTASPEPWARAPPPW